MSLDTRKKLGLIVALGAVAVAAVDRLTVPASVEAGQTNTVDDTPEPAAPVEDLASVFAGLPADDAAESRFALVFRVAVAVADEPEAGDDAALDTAVREPREVALPVLSAVSSADGGIAVIDDRLMRIGEVAGGVTLLDVSGMTATVRIGHRIEVLSVR